MGHDKLKAVSIVKSRELSALLNPKQSKSKAVTNLNSKVNYNS